MAWSRSLQIEILIRYYYCSQSKQKTLINVSLTHDLLIKHCYKVFFEFDSLTHDIVETKQFDIETQRKKKRYSYLDSKMKYDVNIHV
jgi:hypothetical protein